MWELIIDIFAVCSLGLILIRVMWFEWNEFKKEIKEIKEIEENNIPYIDADEDEKISQEIDRFIEENNCYIPKK